MLIVREAPQLASGSIEILDEIRSYPRPQEARDVLIYQDLTDGYVALYVYMYEHRELDVFQELESSNWIIKQPFEQCFLGLIDQTELIEPVQNWLYILRAEKTLTLTIDLGLEQ